MWISHVASKTLSAHADPTTPAGEDGFFGRLLPHPPTAFPLWQEGRLQRETIEACSGFTCFSACAFAPRLHRGLPRRLQPDDCSSSAAPVATGRTDNSPGGTSTRWPSRPRRSLCNRQISSHQTSLRVALPAHSGSRPGRIPNKRAKNGGGQGPISHGGFFRPAPIAGSLSPPESTESLRRPERHLVAQDVERGTRQLVRDRPQVVRRQLELRGDDN